MKKQLIAGTALAGVLAVAVTLNTWKGGEPVPPAGSITDLVSGKPPAEDLDAAETPVPAEEKAAISNEAQRRIDALGGRAKSEFEAAPAAEPAQRSRQITGDKEVRAADSLRESSDVGRIVSQKKDAKTAPASAMPQAQYRGGAPAPSASGPARLQAETRDQFAKGVASNSAQLRAEGLAPTNRPAPSCAAPCDTTRPYYHDEGRDRFEDFENNPVKKTAEEPVSTFSVDVDTASYAFMRKSLSSGHLPQKNAVRVEELINYFDYNYPLPDDAGAPFKASVAVYPTPWNPHTKLLHIGIKGHDIVPSKKPHSNLVFLLDVSGSMNAPDKLPLLKNAFRLLVDTLDPEDTVAIVTYAGNAGTCLEPTKVREKEKILGALSRLQPGGSTAGAQGIEQAYALAERNFDRKSVNRVILATDGDFNVGITNKEELKGFIERKRESGIFLSVLGFGQGNYNDALMQALAQNGNGNAAYIDTLNEARKVLVNEASSTLFPIAKDVKIQIEFNPAQVSEYRLIGYETRALNREDFNNDKVDAGDIGSGHTVTAIYEITPAGSPSALIDDLRYGKAAKGKESDTPDEYAFLKLRYKLPDEDESKLITLPITRKFEAGSIEDVPADVRFAASVAAFGELLRGDSHMGGFSYDDVIGLAKSAKGEDEFGYRAEFVNLVRLAKSAQAM